jgi:hypothetical protein
MSCEKLSIVVGLILLAQLLLIVVSIPVVMIVIGSICRQPVLGSTCPNEIGAFILIIIGIILELIVIGLLVYAVYRNRDKIKMLFVWNN